MGLHKILKIVALVLGVIGAILLAMIWFKGDDEVIANWQSGMDYYMYVAYIIFAIVLFFVVIFVLKGIAGGNIKKTLMSLGAFLLVVVIAYVLATGVETPMRDGKVLSASGSKWVGTGLYTFYILAIVAIGSMIFSGIKKVLK